MIGFIRLRQTGPSPGQSRRNYNAAQKAAWQADAEHWIGAYREKHFTEAGAAEYRYARRTADYQADKLRRFGHTRPLEYTGESRQRTANATTSATSRAGRVRMNAPALNFRNPRGNANPRLELTTISQPEADQIAELHARNFERFVTDHASPQTETL